MTDLAASQTEELRADLERLIADLLAMIEQTRSGSKPVGLDEPIGRLSRMDAMQQQRMTQENRAAAQRRVVQARAALVRMDEDEYGECQSCGEDIGFARLKAAAETPFCVECQGRLESGR